MNPHPTGTTSGKRRRPRLTTAIVVASAAKAMDISGFATSDGAAVAQRARHDGANQQWRFLDSGGGYYRLHNRHSGKVLDDFGTVTNAASGLCMDASGGNTGNGTLIIVWGVAEAPTGAGSDADAAVDPRMPGVATSGARYGRSSGGERNLAGRTNRQ